ncbi:MAG: AbrB/MazE/SpoVT family DNA-binding domain-containing protein [Nocardioides sp.]
MSIGTMTSKGQITVPKDVRLALGLSAGSRVIFTRNAEGDYVIRATERAAAELAGALKFSGSPLSLSDMEDAVTSGALES